MWNLCEIDFGDFWVYEKGILQICWKATLVNCDSENAKNHQKSKSTEFNSTKNGQNWFHVKSEWHKNDVISTLWAAAT